MAREAHDVSGGEIEADEHIVPAARAKANKVAVRQLRFLYLAFQSAVAVYIRKSYPDASCKTLMPIIERKVVPDPIVYADCQHGRNALDVRDSKHRRIKHPKRYANQKNHINGIGKFCNQRSVSYGE